MEICAYPAPAARSEAARGNATIRKEKGMTLQQIADAMGCCPQLISQYENGKRIPKIETQQKIANALNIPIYELTEFYKPVPDIRLQAAITTGEKTQIIARIHPKYGIRSQIFRMSKPSKFVYV